MHQRPLYGRDDLRRLIEPKSIAVVGASPTQGSFGRRTLENLRNFTGAVYGIHPKHREILGRPTFAKLADLPEVPDCVIVCVGQNLAESVIKEAADLGIGGAIVYASGYRETGDADGEAAQLRLLDTARQAGLRLAGPNCIGLLNAGSKAAMNFMTDCGEMIAGEAGSIALVSQSGALGYSLLQGVHRGMGFSKFLACGNSVDVDVGDYVSYLAEDPDTSVIVCLLEGVSDGRRFMEAILKAGRAGKPVIVYKAANGEASGKAAMSHTGTLAGSAEAYRAAFRRAGAVLVEDFEALMEVATFFARNPQGPNGEGVGVMATSGGAGVICADKAEENALPLPALDDATAEVLKDIVPGFGSLANPADLTAEVLKDISTFKAAVTAFCDDPRFGAVVVPLTFVHETTTGVRARYLAEVAASTGTALAAVWMNEWLEGPGSRDLDSDASVTVFRSPARCMWTIRQWMDWHSRTDWTPLAEAAADAVARPAAELLSAPASAAAALTESAAKEIVALYGIPVPAEQVVRTPEEATAAAEAMGYPVVLKVVSPDILHKSEVGGVRVGLASAEEVRNAVEAMAARLAHAAAGARIEGYSVQQMAGDGPEILLGARFDPVFGPLILLGSGGVWVEILKDVRVYLTPLDRKAALEAIDEMTLARVLHGARGEAPYDVEALADVVVAFSRMIRDLDGVAAEIELNPVRITRDNGPMAVDALIVRSVAPDGSTVDDAACPAVKGTAQWANA
ncbi:acetate--CoA ligase family protein [Arthrobacter caoxuetaonis]|uniref:acetate--CoA ligase family protein n=1 Tax=Arthrobacter caoxuetaonis TaxID=2886935 RepID=UPI001D1518F8|nr:acetate--CoA ligase family protein [Arthrobacter caoxuetaonis]MCC3281982.1 acetate--CoA ligase family protein [Arthrobacter caoxuetaonis]MCC3282979.1 acetate--CoA ligase family protein [Arthrobacter caoxuetaonis]